MKSIMLIHAIFRLKTAFILIVGIIRAWKCRRVLLDLSGGV